MVRDKVIYVHYNENGVFYVGIGNKKRPYRKDGRNNFWKKTVDKYGYSVKVIEDNLTLEEAQEKEIDLIDLIGKRIDNKGSLVNISDGGGTGGGLKGYKHTKEARERISKAGVGRFYSKETRKKMSDSSIGKSKNYTNGCSKKIIDTSNNKIYDSITDAANDINISRTTLNAYLSGQNKNRTSLIYKN